MVLTENMFGDILSDLAGELVGSIGLSPAINTNADIAMAQAAHGAAPDIAGQGIANPTGMVLSAAMLLDWLGEKHADRAIAAAGARVVDAVSAVIAGGVKTRDLGGAASTEQFTRALVDHVTRASAEAVAAEVR